MAVKKHYIDHTGSLCGLIDEPKREQIAQGFDEVECKRCLTLMDHYGISSALTVAVKRVDDKVFTINEYRKSVGLQTQCMIDDKPIKMMVMQGTDFCSANCQEESERLWKKANPSLQ